jgi:hypothetical protein
MWKRGFSSEKYVLYNLSKNDWRKYLSDYHAKQSKWINDPYTEILDNKLIFQRVVGALIKVPKNFALIKMGRIYAIDKVSTIQNIENFIKYIKEENVVLKPVYGGGGEGVLLMSYQDGSLLCNKIPFTERKLKERIGNMDGVLITEFIEQDHFHKNLYSESANTIRIVTLRDVDTDEPFIARAAQRIGSKSSAPVDNFSHGGLGSMIDLESGILSPAISYPTSSVFEWYDSHPDTGVSIAGQQIPQWDQIKKKILEAAQNLPFLKCIGWDILLTESGPVALEGNSHPDPMLFQCHGTLLQDEGIYRFYRHHGVI